MKNFEFKGKLFGANIEIAVFGEDEEFSQEVTHKAYWEGVRLESIFNFFDSKSDISKLNESRKMKMPSEFIEVLKKALELCRKTDGKYDVTLGKDFNLRKEGYVITGVGGSYNDVKIEGNLVELKNPDIVLDLGSIAKGYITDMVGEKMKMLGIKEFLINSRGDILINGKREHEIKIQHPRISNESIATLKIKKGGLATSGDYKQYGKDYSESHILNARAYASVSVYAPTLMESDLYSTVFSVISKPEIEEILKEKTMSKFKVLGIDKDLKKDTYNKFEKLIVSFGEDALMREDVDDYLSGEENLVGLKRSGDIDEEDEWVIDEEYSGTTGGGNFILPGKEHDPGHPDFIGGAS
ncbi:MAG: FAD:protein FMN transferase [Nanoarchaeota archaeon]|nr:FAD:protein FMN transferase [Nanoarchaeota archaeon]